MSASEAMRYLPDNIRDWVFGEYKEITANYRLMGPMIRNPSPFGSGPRSDVFNADIDYGELAEFFIANYYETGRWPEQWPASPGWARERDERQKKPRSKSKASAKKAPSKSSNRKAPARKATSRRR